MIRLSEQKQNKHHSYSKIYEILLNTFCQDNKTIKILTEV